MAKKAAKPKVEKSIEQVVDDLEESDDINHITFVVKLTPHTFEWQLG